MKYIFENMYSWAKPILMIAFASLFAYSAINAVRTGRLKPSRFDRVYLRSESPGTFWFHVGVYVFMACALLAAAAAWV